MHADVRGLVSMLLLVTCVVTASAQPVRQIPLKPANATLNAEFVGITSVREVADGRVIVTDGRDQQLYVADFRANTAAILGSKGKGPREWLNVGFVHGLPGDSSIMGDFGNGRLVLFEGARIVGLLAPDHPATRALLYAMSGGDRLGHLLSRKDNPADAAKLEFTRADSSALVLVALSTGRLDTVAQLRQRPRRVELLRGSDGKTHGRQVSPSEPNAQEEIAHLFGDGWISVVRLEPLRVDWRSPDGRWTRGSPFPLRPLLVDARERKAIEARRAQSREEFRRYLVINRAGNIDGEIAVGAREDIMGFGPRSVYIAFKDDDDIQRLRRHPWP